MPLLVLQMLETPVVLNANHGLPTRLQVYVIVYLQFGMHEANKHMTFVSKFGKSQLSHSKVIKTKINYIQNHPALPYLHLKILCNCMI